MYLSLPYWLRRMLFPRRTIVISDEARALAARPYSVRMTMMREAPDTPPYFWVEHPALPGCHAYDFTYEKALDTARDVREMWIQSMLDDGLPVPEPDVHASGMTVGNIVVFVGVE